MERKYQVTIENPDGSGKLVLLGTQHNSERSIEDIDEYFEKHAPDRICIEKSEQAHGIDGKLDRLKYGIELFRSNPVVIFSLILRQLSQVETESEISHICSLAEENNIPIHPVDRNLATVFRELRNSSAARESKANPTDFLLEYGATPDNVIDDPFEYSPQAVCEADELTSDPFQYQYLNRSRNEHMATEVQHLLETHPDDHILFPVGYSHVYGIQKRLLGQNSTTQSSGGNSAALSGDN